MPPWRVINFIIVEGIHFILVIPCCLQTLVTGHPLEGLLFFTELRSQGLVDVVITGGILALRATVRGNVCPAHAWRANFPLRLCSPPRAPGTSLRNALGIRRPK